MEEDKRTGNVLMRLAIATDRLSPHEFPVVSSLVALLGAERVRYIVGKGVEASRAKLGWPEADASWILYCEGEQRQEAEAWMDEADVVLFGNRRNPWLLKRLKEGKLCLYGSERWFKPPWGVLRLLHPGYLLQAHTFVKWLLSRNVYYLAIGIHAARDMARLVGLLSGDWRCLFRPPSVEMDGAEPLGRFRLVGVDGVREDAASGLQRAQDRRDSLYGLHKMRLWGYFVEQGESTGDETAIRRDSGRDSQAVSDAQALNILWAGRMLDWKRVDTLVRAVVKLLDEGKPICLHVIGMGPEEPTLRALAHPWIVEGWGSNRGISFSPPVAMSEVRHLMRKADVYVLPSDGGEGWGAVVNEAMGEGCCIVGTYEAGASATLLRDRENGLLFHARDVAGLEAALRLCFDSSARKSLVASARKEIQEIWSPGQGAKRLTRFAEGLRA